MKKSTICAAILIILVAIFSILFSSCSEETLKQINGPERTVVLMNNNGDTLKTWEGSGVYHTYDNVVTLNIDGKRTTISGGILVAEEK